MRAGREGGREGRRATKPTLRRGQGGEEFGQGVVVLVLPNQVKHVPMREGPGVGRGREGGRGGGRGGSRRRSSPHFLAPLRAGGGAAAAAAVAEGGGLAAGAAAAFHLLLHVVCLGFQELGGGEGGKEGGRMRERSNNKKIIIRANIQTGS